MPEDSASEGPGDGVPAPVSEWLAGIAEERDLSEQELLGRLLAGDGFGVDHEGVDLVERVEELDAQVEALDDRLDEQIQDVRDRVIQVKRETDTKAPADHDHPALAERVERLGENVDALGRDFVGVDDDLARLDEQLAALDERTSAGFSNYEEVLEYLVDATDELDRKVDTLARAVVDLRERTQRLESAETGRAAAERLRESAHEHGITQAKCEDCGGTVHLGLLTSPSCPHCGTQFGSVEPKTGFFGSSILRSGTQPALEGAVGETSQDLDDLIGAEREEAPAVDAVGEAGRSSGTDESSPDERAEEAGLDEDDGRAGPGGAADEAVETITGIGSAYSDRLASAGVETVGDLAFADPERLAEETDIGRDRIDEWVGRARQLADAG